jgi:hypothetical protein
MKHVYWKIQYYNSWKFVILYNVQAQCMNSNQYLFMQTINFLNYKYNRQRKTVLS